MAQWQTIECGNEDSCEPGTVHRFPISGTVRTVRESLTRFVGSNFATTVRSGTVGLVESVMVEAHHIEVVLAGGEHVWIDVDDIEPEEAP